MKPPLFFFLHPQESWFLRMWVFAILIIFGLVGCVSQSEGMPTQTMQFDTSTATVTTIPTGTSTLTPISIIPTSTPSPSITSTPTNSCPARETDLQPGFLSPGMIVFVEKSWSLEPDNLYKLSSTGLELKPFMNDLEPGSFGYFRVSPDGKWLVFRHYIRVEGASRDHYDLILTSSHEAERKIIPWQDDWGSVVLGWIANGEQLIILPRTGFDATWLNEIILVNPFTSQQQRMVLPVEDIWWWETVGVSVVYDPTLTRAAYLEGVDTLVLWDVESEREIWRLEQPALMIKLVPTWSPDGDYLVLVDALGDKDNVWATKFQILIISRDGEEIWRSEVLSIYDDWYHLLDSFQWSPDGRYLSYIWLAPEGDEERTFILDTQSFEVLDYCIQASFPVWSPDSKQFILEETIPVQSAPGYEVYRNVLVDLAKNIVVELDDIPYWSVAWIKTDE